MQFNSHDPMSAAKRVAVRSLFDRARNITLQKEDSAERRTPSHHYFQTQRLSFTFYSCHLLSTETTQATWQRSATGGREASVADPGVVPRVPGHHSKLQGYTSKLLTFHIPSRVA